MKITFKKIEIHNFLSFKDEYFDLAKRRGMTLICGKNNDIPGVRNGCGKSSLFYALLYALFNQLQYPIKIGNLKNKYTKDDPTMTVLVEFSIDGNSTYKIVRGLNKSKQSYCALYHKTKSMQDFEDITKSSIAETQKFIESEILRCDISIFLRTILLSSDQNYNFFRLKPAGKRDFIEKLFNISIFANMYASIHKDTLVLDKDIISRQNRLIVLNKNKDDLSNRLKIYDESKEVELNELRNKLKSIDKELADFKKKSVKVNESEVSKCEEMHNKLIEAKQKLTQKIREIEFDARSKQSSISSLESEIKRNASILKNYSSLLSKLCDDCRPKVEKFYKLDEYKKIVATNEAKINEINAEIEKLKKTISTGKEKSTLIDTKVAENQEKIRLLTEDANKINKKISDLNTDFQLIKSQIDKKEKESNPFTDLFNKNELEIKTESEGLTEVSNKCRYLKFAENIVSQDTLKKFIIKDLVVLLNTKMKYYLSILGAKFECIFDENMDTTFMTPGGECDYENFSSGEQMRLMIASSFSFRDFMETRNNFSSNVLILDEFVDSNIDKYALDGIIKILTNIKKMSNQNVYIISHRQGDLDNSVFDNIIQIEKTDNISKIVYLPNEK